MTPPARTGARPARVLVWLLPALLLGMMPVASISWLYFFGKQQRDLQRAASPDTPVETLKKLARKGNLDVRVRVALNPAAPAEVRRRLAEEPTLRYYAVFQPTAPAEVITAIAEDPKSKRAALVAAARHPNASPMAALALSGHRDPAVRQAVASAPGASREVLCRLARDPDPTVAASATAGLATRGTPCP